MESKGLSLIFSESKIVESVKGRDLKSLREGSTMELE